MKYKVRLYENPAVGKIDLSFDGYLLCYCQRGRLSNIESGVIGTLTHGDMFLLPPNSEAEIFVAVKETYFYTVLFDSALVDESETIRAFLLSLPEDSQIKHKLLLPPEEIVFFESVLNKIAGEQAKDSFEIGKYCILSLLSSLVKIKSLFDELKLAQSYDKESFIKYCVMYADAHCCEELSLSKIIRLSATSRTQFCKLFKKETGLTFNDYLNRKRVQRAMALIKRGEKITDIPYMCGYSEFTTFYRNFKKFTDITPSEYAKRIEKR